MAARSEKTEFIMGVLRGLPDLRDHRRNRQAVQAAFADLPAAVQEQYGEITYQNVFQAAGRLKMWLRVEALRGYRNPEDHPLTEDERLAALHLLEACDTDFGRAHIALAWAIERVRRETLID